MSRTIWKRIIAELPPNLTLAELCQRLDKKYQTVRRAMRVYGYACFDGRRFAMIKYRKLKPEAVDWSLPNCEIARQFNVSRERVRQVRKQRNSVCKITA